MLRFKDFILEAADKTPTAGNAADSMGKVHELLVGGYLNPHEDFPEHYRAPEGSPPEVHHIHATALFGKNYKNNPEYHAMHHNAKAVADMIREHIKKHDVSNIQRVAWTSQPADHEKETVSPQHPNGVKDPNSKADVIVTGHNGKKVAVSLKVGETKTPNYMNPGIATLERWSGVNLAHHSDPHALTLAKYGNPTHKQWKEMARGSSPNGRAMAQDIKNSSDEMNKRVAMSAKEGLAKKSDAELRDIIREAANPPTHLPTVVAHTVLNKDGTATHAVHDQTHHVEKYLSQFEDLHVKPSDNASITIHGRHKKTGQTMRVMNVAVYAGGRPVNKSARGSTTLPSESHKDVVAGMAH